MARIVVTEFASVDGVMEGPGGDNGFVRGAWSFEFDRGADGDRFKLEETMQADALLLGRRTYEGFAAAWPAREGEFADKFNNMPKYVVSSTLEEPDWNNTTVLSGNPAEAVARLKRETEGEIAVHGSAQLVATLVEADLVDEIHLMVFPVVLGTGKRVFGETSDAKKLRLTRSEVVGEGVMILVYERAEAAGEPG